MDVSKIITLARTLTHKTQSQVSDTDIVNYLNLAKDDFWTAIVSAVWENYHWDYWTADTVANQTEYVIPWVASTVEWTMKIDTVAINYDWKKYDNWKLKYIKAEEKDLWSLSKDLTYYEQYADFNKPFYVLNDNSIFIFPTPTVSITGWIKLSWIKNIKDYTTTTLEEEMVISPLYHKILLQWVLPYIYKSIWELKKYQFEMWEYERMKREAIAKLSDRIQTPFYADYEK